MPQHDDVTYPNHPPHAEVDRFNMAVQPDRPRGWAGRKVRRACRRSDGHFWHPFALIDWFCCRCGAQTDGMPTDGRAR